MFRRTPLLRENYLFINLSILICDVDRVFLQYKYEINMDARCLP